MLRISILNDSRRTIFKIEGKLTDEWVAEAAKAWVEFSNASQRQPLVVDLCGVSFVDDGGRELLTRMHSAGAKLVGTGPMSSALIAEVCGDERPNGSSWIRNLLSPFLLSLLLVASLGDNSFVHDRVIPAERLGRFRSQGCIVAVHHPARFLSVAGDSWNVITKGLLL